MACWPIEFAQMKSGIGVSYCLFSSKFILAGAEKTGAIAVLLIVLNPVYADQFDTVNYVATAGINYDSNVFRLPSWADPQTVLGKPGKSDAIRLISAGINIDKKYANQELILGANVTNNSYNTFSNLDYNGTTYKAAANWSLTSRLNGALSADRTQTLTNPADIQTNTRNLNTVDNQRLNADWWFQSDWHLVAGAGNSGTTSTVTTINSLSTTTRTTELGLKYLPSTESSVTVTTRNIRGTNDNTGPDYLLLVDSGYTEKQLALQASWLLTGKSALTGNLVRVKHQYPVFSQRDYTSTQGDVSGIWSISDKTRLVASLSRSTSSWYDTYSSYIVTDTVSLAPSWQISARTGMHMALSRSRSDYLGQIVANVSARRDDNQSIEIGLAWSPQRSVSFSAMLQRTWRASNYSAFEFGDNLASLSVTGSF